MEIKLSLEQMRLHLKIFQFFSLRPEANLLTKHEREILEDEIQRFIVLIEQNAGSTK